MALGRGANCAKVLLIIFNFLFWLTGLGLVAFGIVMIVDPRRSYLLDIVHISESDPLLRIAAYIFLGVGCFTILIGFLGCCGALKEVQCMLVGYLIFLVLILGLEAAAGVLSLVMKDKLDGQMHTYMHNVTVWKYGRQQWATQLMDNIQYWRECCGTDGPGDYNQSYWQINRSGGTILWVPESCCTQKLDARPPNFQPIDALNCQQYQNAPLSARHNLGCYQTLKGWYDEHATIFVILGLVIAGFQVFGIIFSVCLCRNVGEEL